MKSLVVLAVFTWNIYTICVSDLSHPSLAQIFVYHKKHFCPLGNREVQRFLVCLLLLAIYTQSVRKQNPILLSWKKLPGTNHTSVRWETDSCIVQRVLGLIVETFYIDRILMRNWSPLPWSCVNYCLAQTTVLSVGKQRGAEYRGVKGCLLVPAIRAESFEFLYGTKHTSVRWKQRGVEWIGVNIWLSRPTISTKSLRVIDIPHPVQFS